MTKNSRTATEYRRRLSCSILTIDPISSSAAAAAATAVDVCATWRSFNPWARCSLSRSSSTTTTTKTALSAVLVSRSLSFYRVVNHTLKYESINESLPQ